MKTVHTRMKFSNDKKQHVCEMCENGFKLKIKKNQKEDCELNSLLCLIIRLQFMLDSILFSA